MPQQAVQRDPKGNATALIITAENKVEKRVVTTDRAIGDTWLINSGLSAGDRVVVEGVNKVRPGDSVRIVDVTATLGKATNDRTLLSTDPFLRGLSLL